MKKNLIAMLTAVIAALTICACDTECRHKPSKIEYVAATCTEDGNIEYWQCSECGKKFKDQNATEEITDTVIPAAHRFGDYEYDYENKVYVRECSECDDLDNAEAGSEQYPLLARDEAELIAVINSAESESFIRLANDITINAGMYQSVLRLPDNGTLDLGGHTVTVKNNGGFLVEGANVTLQNGKVVTDFKDQTIGYAVFLGDDGDDNNVTVKNLDTEGGVNVYNCIATFYECNIDAGGRLYYALWADSHATITVESGVYRGGKNACVHSSASSNHENSGYFVFNGGTFNGKIIATYCTTVNGGKFDAEIVLTPYAASGETEKVPAKLVVNKNYTDKDKLNITVASGYEISESLEDGNRVYETLPLSSEPAN